MSYNLDDAYIIGITGTVGKTSTAYLVHEYLKSIGKKSILYCSLGIDSPYSHQPQHMEYNYIYDMKEVANILNEALAYHAEFIILEINEFTIPEIVDVPFDIKVLTNFNASANIHITPEVMYQKKLLFFQDEEDAVCMFNVKSEKVEDFIRDGHVANVVLYDTAAPNPQKDANYEAFFERYRSKQINHTVNDILYYPISYHAGLEQSSMEAHMPSQSFSLNTTLITRIHLENIMSAIAILDQLFLMYNGTNLDVNEFQRFISNEDLTIEGRLQDFQWNDRNIIIDYNRVRGLKEIHALKYPFNRLVVVAGERGDISGANQQLYEEHPEYTFTRDYTRLSKYLNQYADFVFLTTDNINEYSAQELTTRVAENLNVPYVIYESRREAIRQAILQSQPNDIICIVGRGNRMIFKTSFTGTDKFNDIEVAKEAIREYEETH